MAEISNDCWLNLAVSPLHSTFHSITPATPCWVGFCLPVCVCVQCSIIDCILPIQDCMGSGGVCVAT